MIQASSSGKILAWPSGRLMGACGCCASPAPDCLHLALYYGEILAEEADLLFVPGDTRGGLVWAINQTAEYPWQLHWIVWNCSAGTVGYWTINVDYYPDQASHVHYGVGTAASSYCDGLSGSWDGFYSQTVVVSACVVPGGRRVQRGNCSGCRGL